MLLSVWSFMGDWKQIEGGTCMLVLSFCDLVFPPLLNPLFLQWGGSNFDGYEMMTRIAVRFSLLPAGSIAFPLKLDAFSVLFCMAAGTLVICRWERMMAGCGRKERSWNWVPLRLIYDGVCRALFFWQIHSCLGFDSWKDLWGKQRKMISSVLCYIRCLLLAVRNLI